MNNGKYNSPFFPDMMRNPSLFYSKDHFLRSLDTSTTIPDDIKMKAREIVAPIEANAGNKRGTTFANRLTATTLPLLLDFKIRSKEDPMWNIVREKLGLPVQEIPAAPEVIQNAVVANANAVAANAVAAAANARVVEAVRTNKYGIQYNKNDIPIDPKYNRFRGIPLQHEYSGDPLREYYELDEMIAANIKAAKAAQEAAQKASQQVASTPLSAANQSGFFGTALGYGSKLRALLPFGGKRTRKHRKGSKKSRKGRKHTRKH